MLILVSFCPAAAQHHDISSGEQHPSAENLGEISFPTSGPADAQKHFIRGVLLLHSFEYGRARTAFAEASRIAPGFAMAYWGEAMTHNHSIWAEQDRDEAIAVLNRLAPTPAERAAKAPKLREKLYFAAVEKLYGEGDKAAARCGIQCGAFSILPLAFLMMLRPRRFIRCLCLA